MYVLFWLVVIASLGFGVICVCGCLSVCLVVF